MSDFLKILIITTLFLYLIVSFLFMDLNWIVNNIIDLPTRGLFLAWIFIIFFLSILINIMIDND